MALKDSIEWVADIESVLQQIAAELNNKFEGSKYHAVRNTTVGEKDVDVFAAGKQRRVLAMWPDLIEKTANIMLDKELAEAVQLNVGIKPDETVKKMKKYPNKRLFNDVNMEVADAMVDVIAKR